MPKISIILAAYNAADTLEEALDSLMEQTLRDFEIFLCDDGSTDGTAAVAQAYAARHPGRVVLLQNPQNLGLGAALNRCLAVAQGEYIARMDADDLSLPRRLELQAAFLDAHPDCALVGCAMTHFDQGGSYRVSCPPEDPQLRDHLLGTPFCHGTVMVRREVYLSLGGYSESPEHLRVEDAELWLRLYEAGFRGRNLQEPLYRMRDDRSAANRRKLSHRFRSARVRLRGMQRLQAPWWYWPLALRPVAVGLLPGPVYRWLHRRKWRKGP